MRKVHLVRPMSANKGACTHCGKEATKEVLFKEDGIVVIEKYCEECLRPEIFSQIQAFYARFN